MLVLVNIYEVELKYNQIKYLHLKKQVILLVVLEFWYICAVKQGFSFDV